MSDFCQVLSTRLCFNYETWEITKNAHGCSTELGTLIHAKISSVQFSTLTSEIKVFSIL